MLKRSIDVKLKKWKEKEGHHPLIVTGLRQTGKTFSVRHFGSENYESVVYMDLRASKTLHSVFAGDFDVDKMVSRITVNLFDARFIPGKTLVIMDEIQDCPNARSSLKYWDLDGRYDVIATGSFLGVKGFRQPYDRGVPVGYEELMTMYPLTFREFLDNYGMPNDILDYVQNCMNTHSMIDAPIHQRMRDLYYEYLVVGGMPEAVNEFLKNHDLNAVRAIQQRIITSLKADFGRYIDSKGNDAVNETLKLRAEACLDSLPAQLSKEYKKFQYSKVDSKAHAEDKADALQYLVDLGLVIKSYNLREIANPLESAKISNEYKAFFSDTGLLISQLGNDAARSILNGDLGAYKGAVAENMIAVGFHSNGQSTYYYRGSTGSPELDFVVVLNHIETIVECKANRGKPTSMKYVLEHPEKYGKHPAIKISDTNMGQGKNFKTYPIYFCGFIAENDDGLIIPIHRFDDLAVPEK